MPLGGHVPSYRTLSSQLRPWGTRPTNTARGRIESIGTQGMISAYLERKFSRPRAGPGNQKVRELRRFRMPAFAVGWLFPRDAFAVYCQTPHAICAQESHCDDFKSAAVVYGRDFS